MKATGITTQKALIDHALRELLRHERQAGLNPAFTKIGLVDVVTKELSDTD